MDADELARREKLADLTRNGEVALVHPDLPDRIVGVMPESVPRMLANGWEKHDSEPADGDEPLVVEGGTGNYPAGNASADVWRDYAASVGLNNVDVYSRDELRDHYLNGAALPDKDE